MVVKLTNDLLEDGASSRMGYNYDQLKILGVNTPLTHGWKNIIIGKIIHEDTYSLYLKLKGLKPKERKVYADDIERVCKIEFGE